MNRKKVFLGITILGLLIAYFLLLSNILGPRAKCNEGYSLYPILEFYLMMEKPIKLLIRKINSIYRIALGKRVEVVGIVEDLEGEIEITMNSIQIYFIYLIKGEFK